MISVLVIDDDVAVAELMRVVLEEADFRVTVAHDARDVPEARFACVLTDLVGVGVYSFEDARDWLLRLRDRFPRTPVVVVTAHSQARRDAARLGAPIVLKPFDVDTLVAAVREATS